MMGRTLRKLTIIAGYAILIVLPLLVVIRLLLPPLAVYLINSGTIRPWNSDIHIEKFDISLLEGIVEIEGLTVAQPAGFSGDQLASFSGITIRVAVGSLLRLPLIVREAEIVIDRADLVWTKDGEFNIESLFSTSPSRQKLRKKAVEGITSPAKPIIRIEDCSVTIGRADYVDYSLGDNPLRFIVKDCDLRVTGLIVDPDDPGRGNYPARFRLNTSILQGEEEPASLKLRARLGPVGYGIPEADCVLEFSSLRSNFLQLPVTDGIMRRFAGNTLSFRLEAMTSPRVIEGKITGLTLRQPPPLRKGFWLEDAAVSARLDVDSLSAPPVIISDCRLGGAAVTLVKEPEGGSTIAGFFSSSSPETADPPGSGGDDPGAGELLIEKCSFEDLVFRYRDSTLPAGELEIEGKDIDCRIENFSVGGDKDTAGPGSLRLTARLSHADASDGYLGAAARFGPLGGGLFDLNAVLLVIGLRLKPLEPVLPSGTAAALGGAGIDLLGEAALCPRHLSALITVRSSGGHTFSLPVEGPPDNPRTDTSNVLFDILARSGGGVGNLVANLPGAGWEVARGAWATVSELGKGIANVFGAFGEGLYGIGKGAVEADLSEMGGGLYRATGGPIREAAGGVFAAGGEMLGGFSGAGSAAWGAGDRENWESTIPDRWKSSWKKVRCLLEKMPFPPCGKNDKNGSGLEADNVPPDN